MYWIEKYKRGGKKRDGWGEWDSGTEWRKLVEASLPRRRSFGSLHGTRDEPLKASAYVWILKLCSCTRNWKFHSIQFPRGQTTPATKDTFLHDEWVYNFPLLI